jgi:hypothetical protein
VDPATPAQGLIARCGSSTACGPLSWRRLSGKSVTGNELHTTAKNEHHLLASALLSRQTKDGGEGEVSYFSGVILPSLVRVTTTT